MVTHLSIVHGLSCLTSVVKTVVKTMDNTEMGDHLEIIFFSSVLLILLNSLISLRELYKTPNVSGDLKREV